MQADGVTEGFELGDQAAGFPFGVQAGGEVVLAELVVGCAGGQDVPDADQQRVRDDDDRFLFRGRAAVWSTLPSLWTSDVLDCTTLVRYRRTSRAALMSAGGMKLPRSSFGA